MHTKQLGIKIKKLHPDATIPQYATDGSSGFDLVSIEEVAIAPGETKLVKTGLSMEIPKGFELQIRPRSGISLKTTLRVSNSPGTVDSDYRGEIAVIITNIESQCHDSMGNGCGCRGSNGMMIEKGDKIAQGVFCPISIGEFFESDSLEGTERGEGGFGSTGK